MNKSTLPNCSVIVLNYFGEKVIANTLKSLINLNYPKDKYEVIVVDNASSDKSRDIINNWAKKYSNIKPLYLNRNLGFAGGNNEGIKKATGDYVVLLNNDCVVEKDWLLELAKIADSDPKIFAVNSKILLYPKYLRFNLVSEGIMLQEISLKSSHLLNYVSRINIPWHLNVDKRRYEGELIFDPFYESKIEISLKCHVKQTKTGLSKINLYLGPNNILQTIKCDSSTSKGVYNFKINLSDKYSSLGVDKIQNAGIMVFQDGAGRDIGAVITNQTQNYEIDYGQYSQTREVYAACGAAVLYNKKLLEKIGLLDETFFMYYEDVEVAERARLRGWKVFYCPKAVVRHLHALSSKEWSNFFIYHTEKGRLLHTIYHFPLHVFFAEYLGLWSRLISIFF